jgi:hypothetical protein
MATPTGRTRRPNRGKGATTTQSISFDTRDFLWLEEQARMQVRSFSLVVSEAVRMYRDAIEKEIAAIDQEQKAASGHPEAPVEL